MQSSAFVMFPDVHSACAAASVLRDKTAVDAVEMFDRAALRCSRGHCWTVHMFRCSKVVRGLSCCRVVSVFVKLQF